MISLFVFRMNSFAHSTLQSCFPRHIISPLSLLNPKIILYWISSTRPRPTARTFFMNLAIRIGLQILFLPVIDSVSSDDICKERISPSSNEDDACSSFALSDSISPSDVLLLVLIESSNKLCHRFNSTKQFCIFSEKWSIFYYKNEITPCRS